jgi:pimeloyl-ACP methyl ester carboxylesterase
VTEARLTPPRLGRHLAWLPFEGVRAFAERLFYVPSAPLLERAPRGDGHPVLVLPGFLAADDSTRVLRRYLRKLGYSSHPWLLGRNLGSRGLVRERLVERAAELADRHGRKLSLVGWSLGGIYARELAKRMPELVRQVITLGSPFGDAPETKGAPPVPATAIYSKTDGVTHWRSCRESDGPERENIEVPGSHCGLGWNPLALWAIADRLAQTEGAWRPFERDGWREYLYR